MYILVVAFRELASERAHILNASREKNLQSVMALLLQDELFLQAIIMIQISLLNSYLSFLSYKAVANCNRHTGMSLINSFKQEVLAAKQVKHFDV